MQPDRALRAVPATQPRAVLYLRQSVSRDDSISLELQETACRDYCARRGYTVAEVIADPGISGRTWNRPGVQRTLDLIEQRQADVIVLWRWSRLSRSRKDWAVAVDRVEVAGGAIESATEPVDVSTAAGRLQRGMLAELAAWESEVKGEQWREAQARRRSLGLPHSGGYRPGYVYEDKQYRPDPETAPLVAGAYDRFTGGMGTRRLAAWLNTVQLPTRGRGSWTFRSASRLLESGWGAGMLHVHDPLCGCPNRNGACERRIHIAGAHTAIISDEQWAAYLVEADRRSTTPRRLLTPSTPLSGLVRCGTCGYGMRTKQANRTRSNPLYACVHVGCPRPTTVVRHRAEAAALGWLASYAHDVDQAAAVAASDRASRAAAKTSINRLARSTNQLDNEMVGLAREYARGIIPEAVYIAARDELAAERETASTALAEATRQLGPELPARSTAAELLADWDTISVQARNTICRNLLRVVATRGDRNSTVTVVAAWEWTPPTA
jgi:site-specific DNA recombinase